MAASLIIFRMKYELMIILIEGSIQRKPYWFIPIYGRTGNFIACVSYETLHLKIYVFLNDVRWCIRDTFKLNQASSKKKNTKMRVLAFN